MGSSVLGEDKFLRVGHGRIESPWLDLDSVLVLAVNRRQGTGRVLGRHFRHCVRVTSGPDHVVNRTSVVSCTRCPARGLGRLDARPAVGLPPGSTGCLALAAGVANATSQAYVVRLAKEDDSEFVLTMDLNFRRINLEPTTDGSCQHPRDDRTEMPIQGSIPILDSVILISWTQTKIQQRRSFSG